MKLVEQYCERRYKVLQVPKYFCALCSPPESDWPGVKVWMLRAILCGGVV
jgi:hypothetical protein